MVRANVLVFETESATTPLLAGGRVVEMWVKEGTLGVVGMVDATKGLVGPCYTKKQLNANLKTFRLLYTSLCELTVQRRVPSL
jgi:hypothetical protein